MRVFSEVPPIRTVPSVPGIARFLMIWASSPV